MKSQPRIIIIFFDISVSNECVVYFEISEACLLTSNFVASVPVISLCAKIMYTEPKLTCYIEDELIDR